MNKELYSYLGEHNFYLNKGEFRYITETYGKEECRKNDFGICGPGTATVSF